MSEDNKLKKITVKEIKELDPKAEVYELNKHNKYIVMIKQSALVGGKEAAMAKARNIFQAVNVLDIKASILIGFEDGDIKFYEFE